MTAKERPSKSREASPERPPSFEEEVRELGVIVEKLESGDLPLEESLALFERGIGLARHAQGRLDAAEKRVEELLGFDETGAPVTRELEED
jgi:exodeoxyribonuclease VII small subunit